MDGIFEGSKFHISRCISVSLDLSPILLFSKRVADKITYKARLVNWL